MKLCSWCTDRTKTHVMASVSQQLRYCIWLRLMPHMSYVLTFPEVIIEVMPVIIGPDICCDVVSLCIWTLHIYNLQIAAGNRFMESRTAFGFVVWAFFDLTDGQCNRANVCKPADLEPARIFYAGLQSSSCAGFILIHSALFWKSCFPLRLKWTLKRGFSAFAVIMQWRDLIVMSVTVVTGYYLKKGYTNTNTSSLHWEPC